MAFFHLRLVHWLALVKLNLLVKIIVRALKESRGLVTSSNLKKRIRLRMSSLALFTDIKVGSHTALVSDSSYRSSFTDITNYVVMNLSLLISSSLS